MSEFAAPAETYKLNTLASVLGRYAVPNPSSETLTQVGEMLDVTIDDIMTHDTPPVPHTRAELLEEALIFDQKLLRQLHKGPAGQHITGVQRSTVEGLLNQHAEYCLDMRQRDSSWQMLATTDAIAKAYGLRELWSSPDSVIAEEVSRWGRDTVHPEVPPLLAKRVSLDETKQLMGLMWRKVIGAEHDPDVNVYLTDDVDNYHVYWSPTAERLDYATPRSYDRA